jgi:hypothetical protein
MGDARLGVNPDAMPENKRLRRGGAFSLSDRLFHASLFLCFLLCLAFFGG